MSILNTSTQEGEREKEKNPRGQRRSKRVREKDQKGVGEGRRERGRKTKKETEEEGKDEGGWGRRETICVCERDTLNEPFQDNKVITRVWDVTHLNIPDGIVERIVKLQYISHEKVERNSTSRFMRKLHIRVLLRDCYALI